MTPWHQTAIDETPCVKTPRARHVDSTESKFHLSQHYGDDSRCQVLSLGKAWPTSAAALWRGSSGATLSSPNSRRESRMDPTTWDVHSQPRTLSSRTPGKRRDETMPRLSARMLAIESASAAASSFTRSPLPSARGGRDENLSDNFQYCGQNTNTSTERCLAPGFSVLPLARRNRREAMPVDHDSKVFCQTDSFTARLCFVCTRCVPALRCRVWDRWFFIVPLKSDFFAMHPQYHKDATSQISRGREVGKYFSNPMGGR